MVSLPVSLSSFAHLDPFLLIFLSLQFGKVKKVKAQSFCSLLASFLLFTHCSWTWGHQSPLMLDKPISEGAPALKDLHWIDEASKRKKINHRDSPQASGQSKGRPGKEFLSQWCVSHCFSHALVSFFRTKIVVTEKLGVSLTCQRSATT